MPVNVVHTKKQERAWERAKRLARKQYPNIDDKSDRFYRIVMTIYKDIAHYKPKKKKK